MGGSIPAQVFPPAHPPTRPIDLGDVGISFFLLLLFTARHFSTSCVCVRPRHFKQLVASSKRFGPSPNDQSEMKSDWGHHQRDLWNFLPVSSFPPAFYSKLGREGKEKAIRRQRQSIHLDGALSLTAPTHLLSGRTSSLRGLFLQFKLVAPIPSCVPKSFEIILFELVAVWVGFIVLIDAPVCCLSSLLAK